MSQMRRVCFVPGVAVIAVGSASAWSSSSTNPSGNSAVSAGESSSNENEFLADNVYGDAAALRTAEEAAGKLGI
jgi:hypothetical protein